MGGETMDKTVIKYRLEWRVQTLEKLYKAYEALVETGVKSYQMDDRTLTRLDLPALSAEISKLEDEVDQLDSLLDGAKPRKAWAVVPRDW